MRLLNAKTFQIESVFPDDRPEYAILSHRWAAEEVSLHEINTKTGQQKQGYAKIRSCCETALANGITHVWIDTCCIDKHSSAELSEAINSMFRYYTLADVCYAYLSDVAPMHDFMAHFHCTQKWHNQKSCREARYLIYKLGVQSIDIAPFRSFVGADGTSVGGRSKSCSR